jgi:hypothetical protein
MTSRLFHKIQWLLLLLLFLLLLYTGSGMKDGAAFHSSVIVASRNNK